MLISEVTARLEAKKKFLYVSTIENIAQLTSNMLNSIILIKAKGFLNEGF
ncbi:MAG: hypothetical protein GX906_03130 [Clostridiales bacterium]|jgi:hypothetical protein|nr:hypothetical protein [Clostridiales bacterium]